MAYCANCGTKNDEGMMFCSNCGSNVADPQPSKQVVQETTTATPATQNFTPPPNNSGNQLYTPPPTGGTYPTYPQTTGEKTGYATAALVLGILSLFCSMIYLSPVAMILGIIGRKRAPSVKGRATAGMVMGIIGTVIIVAIIVVFVVSMSSDSEFLNKIFN